MALAHLLLAGAIGLHVAIPFLLPEDARSDFGYFHASAASAVRGGSPYAVPPTPSAQGAEAADAPAGAIVNLNPPFQSVLLAPLGLLPYTPAMWIWYGLSVVSGVLAGVLMARTLVPDRPTLVWGPLFASGILLFLPALANAWTAQFGLLLTLVAAGALHLAAHGRIRRAGLVLGLAAGVKLFVGLFGAYFLLTRRWRGFLAFVLAWGATVLVGAAVLGWPSHAHYLALLGEVDWHAWSWNVSVFGPTTRALGSPVSQGLFWHAPTLGLPVARVLALAVGAAYGILVLLRARGRSPQITGLGVGLTWVSVVLLSPLGWLYYLPTLLPSCGFLVGASRAGAERRWSVAAVVVFLALASVPQQPYSGPELTSSGFDWWKTELPFLGLTILVVAHGCLLWRRGEGATDRADPPMPGGARREGPTPPAVR